MLSSAAAAPLSAGGGGTKRKLQPAVSSTQIKNKKLSTPAKRISTPKKPPKTPTGKKSLAQMKEKNISLFNYLLKNSGVTYQMLHTKG